MLFPDNGKYVLFVRFGMISVVGIQEDDSNQFAIISLDVNSSPVMLSVSKTCADILEQNACCNLAFQFQRRIGKWQRVHGRRARGV